MFYKICKLYNNVFHSIVGDWKYFLFDNFFHERAIIKEHYYKLKELFPNKRVVMYLANGFCNHAGLCDRFKGITTLYGWCKECGLDFRVFHIHPFDLSDYLIPNQYDWHITEKEVCYDKRYTSVNYLMLNNLVRKQIESGEIANLEKTWFLHRIKTKKNQMHFYTNMQPESNLLFGTLFKELFKPSARLEKAIDFHKQSIGVSYISISFRYMQLLGDFKDCDGDTLSEKMQEELICKSINIVKVIKEQNKCIPKILVTSDSSKFLTRVKKLPFVYIVEGKVGHINFHSSDDVNMKTFLDFFMIANANKVYLAKSEKMYNSDFARRASMIYNKTFEIINF